MPRQSVPQLTWSAYPKRDVLAHMCRAIHAGDPETACYMSAEMVCAPAPSSLSELCSTLIDVYSGLQSRMSGAHDLAFTLHAFACFERSVSPLLAIAPPTPPACGRRLHEEDAVQKGVCAAVVFLAQLVRACYGSHPQPAPRASPASRVPAWPSLAGETRAGKQRAEAAMDEAAAIKATFRPLQLPGAALDALWSVFAMCTSPSTRPEDLDARIAALGERAKPGSVPSPPLPDLPRLEGPAFAEVTCGVRAHQRSDVHWYLWHLCVTVSSAHDPRAGRVVQQALRLFKHRHTAANRAVRVPLLCFAYRVAARRPSPTSPGCVGEGLRVLDSIDRLMRKAQADIHIVYNDILGQEGGHEDREAALAAAPPPPIPQSEEPRAHTERTATVMERDMDQEGGGPRDEAVQPAPLTLEEKLRFVWCYTLRDDRLRLAIEAEIQDKHARLQQQSQRNQNQEEAGVRKVSSSHIAAHATTFPSRRHIVTKRAGGCTVP